MTGVVDTGATRNWKPNCKQEDWSLTLVVFSKKFISRGLEDTTGALI